MNARREARIRSMLKLSPVERLRRNDEFLSRVWRARRRWTDIYPEDDLLWQRYFDRLDTMDPDVVDRTVAAIEDVLPGASAAGDADVRRWLSRGDPGAGPARAVAMTAE
jgi:hypothetical protein